MIEQALIVVCGVASQSPSFDSRRWAPIVGLAAQPASIKAEQYGIAALTFVYAAGWARGIRTYWFAR